MKLSKNLLLLNSYYFLGTAAFTPNRNRPSLFFFSTSTNNRISSTNIFSAIPTSRNDEDISKQTLARDALLKLMEKQTRDLETTKALLENLEELKQSDKESIQNINTSASTLVKSIYSGTDYGYISRSEGCRFETLDDLTDELFENYGPPQNIFKIGSQQFMRNLDAIKGEYKDEDVNLTRKQQKLQNQLESLTLSSAAIWEREKARGEIVAPLIIKVPYYVLCYFLDVVFEGRNVFSRFFLLETVARMPYFSYITMLHLYETLGFWRRSAEQKRVHFAEEWNEFHHLLIMESLGGDQPWWVRFLAQHSAIVYFLVLTHLFAISPSLSYKFSEMLETHAVDTYGQFIDENEEQLKKLPPPLVALEYYSLGIADPLFGEYQTSAQAKNEEIRKPGKDMQNLYDVFTAIRADEGDHVGTMKACLDPSVPVLTPALETRVLIGLGLAASAAFILSSGGSFEDVLGTETVEGVDGTILEGIVGAGAALIGGMREVMSESGAEEAVEEAGVASFEVSMFFNFLRQAFAAFLEALGIFL